jgi:outer membrane autotransporter protein
MTEPKNKAQSFSIGRTSLLSAALMLALSTITLNAAAGDPRTIEGSEITEAATYPKNIFGNSSSEEIREALITKYHYTEEEAAAIMEKKRDLFINDPPIDVLVNGTVSLQTGSTDSKTTIRSWSALTLDGNGNTALDVKDSALDVTAYDNMTVKGNVNLENSSVTLQMSGSESVINGTVSVKNDAYKKNLALTINSGSEDFSINGDIALDAANLTVGTYGAANSEKINFNGNITATGSTLSVSRSKAVNDTLTFNGSIRLYNSTFEIQPNSGENNSVVINGDISVDGNTDSSYKPTICPVTLPDDYTEELPELFAGQKRFRRSFYSAVSVGYLGPGYTSDNIKQITFDEKPASVFSIGSLDTHSSTYSVVKLDGDVSVNNTDETANSVWLTLDAPEDGDWTWNGSATMTGTDWQGSAYNQTGIMITAKEGAVWKVTGEESAEYGKLSTISRWNSLGSTTIDLTASDDNLTLQIDELTGNGTTIVGKIGGNAAGTDIETDLVVLGGRSSGEHTVKLQATGREVNSISGGEITYLKVLPLKETAALTSPNKTSGLGTPEEANKELAGSPANTYVYYQLTEYRETFDNGIPAFSLAYEENAEGSGKTATLLVNGTKTSTYIGIHYLMGETDAKWLKSLHQETEEFEPLIIHYSNAENKVDIGNYKYTILDPKILEDGTVVFNVLAPDIPAATFEDLSDAAEIVTTLGGDGAMYSAWMADLTDLRKRLGEVRYGAQDGVWARGIAQKDRLEGVTGADFKQKLYGLQMGLDHIVTQDEDRMWLLGGNLKLNTVDQKVDAMRYGHGDMRSYGAFLYATYANYKGCYTDLVLSVDHYKQKMSAEQTDDSYVHGRYNTWGWGASVEVGRMFSSAQNDEGWGPWYGHWWAEPQAQLAYYWINGKRFSMDNEMSVRQKNGNSLIGRLGVVVGKKFNYGANRKEVDKRYSQFYLKGGVKHEFLGKQTLYVNDQKFSDRLRGTTVYYGAGFDWNLSDQLRLYAQVERERGSRYRKDYEVSAGLKWQF